MRALEVSADVRFAVLISLLPLLFGCSWAQQDRGRDELVLGEINPSVSAARTHRPTARELQTRLMSYADRYLSKVAEATVNFEKQVNTREAKDLALSTFIFPGLAVIGIAAGDDPASDLLDMVVLATLQHRVLADGWAAEVLGRQAGPLLEAQAKLEQQAWQIAGDVLSAAQRKELRATIDLWRRRNPKQRFVSNVHFDEMAVMRGQHQSLRGLPTSDGLLAPIDEAVRKAEEFRLVAERGLYLMQRMPPLILAQARYVVHESVTPGQVGTMLQDFSAMSTSLSDAQKTFATFPPLISAERQAVFREWDQRQTALAKLLASTAPVFEAGKGMTAEIHQTVASAEKLADTYRTSGAVLNETLTRYRDLLKFMDSQAPSDPTNLLRILDATTRLGQEVNQLAGRAEHLPAPLVRELMVGSVTGLMNAVLWRLIALTAAVLCLLFLYRYLARRYLGKVET